jgi:hypothetical protein
VNSAVLREPDLREAATLVIARHDEHRDALVGDSRERLERLPRDARRHTRTIEDVPAMHDEIDLPRERRLQRRPVVRQKVVATTASLDARTRGQVEAQVRVGE